MTNPLHVKISDTERDARIVDDKRQINLQHDWNAGLSNLNEDVWVTWKSSGNPTLYGTIRRINESEDLSSIATTNGFKVIQWRSSLIQIGHCMSSMSTIFLTPSKSYSSFHQKKRVASVTVNPHGLVVSAFDEKMIVWDSKYEVQKLELEGHVGEIYKCKYFPSGKVILSCGSDMMIKIWCAFSGKCVATLKSHKLAVTDVHFVGVGRNVVSVSKDGLVKLWNCGDSLCIADVYNARSSINCCEVVQAPENMILEEPKNYLSQKEDSTDRKIVLIGCEDGTVSCVSLKSRQYIFTQSLNSSVNCLAFIPQSNYVVGCQNGEILMFDLLDTTRTPSRLWDESQSAVLSLLPYKNYGFFASRADGTVTFTFLNFDKVNISLSGSNFDPVYSLAYDGNYLYTSCRDGSVRKYLIVHVLENVFVNSQ